MKFNRPIIVIAGPTASGKSSLAIKLAKDINGVIINADSRQIYKELNIGTAKPTPDQVINDREWVIDGVKHYLYGYISITESYNIYKYQKDVQDILDNLPMNVTPILVGGTGLYIDSIVFNYKLKDTSNDTERRNDLRKLSVKELQEKIDKDILDSLNDSDRNNPVRLVRIIERGSSKDIKGVPLSHKYFVIDIDKNILKKRIAQRVDEMFEHGLLEENQKIYDQGLFNNPAVLKTIGYTEFLKHFEKGIPIEQVKREIILNTNKYAKRQRTWFKKNKAAIYTVNYDYLLEESLRLINTL